MSKSIEDILKTEYSERFDEIRKNMMVMSYYKYGSMKDNYDKFKCMDALGNIEKRIQKYKETGNTEFLADVAYFVKGWNKARGCLIENECAFRYGIKTIRE